MIKIIPILMGVLIPYIVALCCGMIDFSGVAQADIVGLPPFQMAKFDLSAILIMAPIAIASMMEHIGDISAISATCGENYIEDPGLHRSLIGDGLATSLAALFGGPANTTYGENTGVLVLSRVYDPRVVRIAAYGRDHPFVQPRVCGNYPLHSHCNHRRRFLCAVRHDFRGRRAQRSRK